jgi:hypothetical protein
MELVLADEYKQTPPAAPINHCGHTIMAASGYHTTNICGDINHPKNADPGGIPYCNPICPLGPPGYTGASGWASISSGILPEIRNLYKNDYTADDRVFFNVAFENNVTVSKFY